MFDRCLFCGGNGSAPDHLTYCDGRQGGRDDDAFDPTNGVTPPASLPFSGITDTTRATSEAAAHQKTRVQTERGRVLAFIKARPNGATDQEIQAALEMSGNTERPRRIELFRMGCIVDTGATRPTEKGRRAAVWQFVIDMSEAM